MYENCLQLSHFAGRLDSSISGFLQAWTVLSENLQDYPSRTITGRIRCDRYSNLISLYLKLFFTLKYFFRLPLLQNILHTISSLLERTCAVSNRTVVYCFQISTVRTATTATSKYTLHKYMSESTTDYLIQCHNKLMV